MDVKRSRTRAWGSIEWAPVVREAKISLNGCTAKEEEVSTFVYSYNCTSRGGNTQVD
jgi:hypothetical protein